MWTLSAGGRCLRSNAGIVRRRQITQRLSVGLETDASRSSAQHLPDENAACVRTWKWFLRVYGRGRGTWALFHWSEAGVVSGGAENTVFVGGSGCGRI
jgi:hypothetical protein